MIINLYGGPGTGKSTTAAHLFALMKHKGMSCELVTEFAKDLTWEDRQTCLSNQVYVLGEQHRRLERVKNKVDYVITDSPLLLSCVYATGPLAREICSLSKRMHYLNHTFDVFLERVKPYDPVGRNQSEKQAKEIDQLTLEIIGKVDAKIPAQEGAAEWILNKVEGLK